LRLIASSVLESSAIPVWARGTKECFGRGYPFSLRKAARSVNSGLYGEAVKLARALSFRAVQRLGELMESEDERVSVVACNSLLDRAFGKPKAAEVEKDDMDARLASMSREERLAEVTRLLADLERLSRLRQSLGRRGRESRKLGVLGGQVGEG
jgi:hypothetical protein